MPPTALTSRPHDSSDNIVILPGYDYDIILAQFKFTAPEQPINIEKFTLVTSNPEFFNQVDKWYLVASGSVTENILLPDGTKYLGTGYNSGQFFVPGARAENGEVIFNLNKPFNSPAPDAAALSPTLGLLLQKNQPSLVTVKGIFKSGALSANATRISLKKDTGQYSASGLTSADLVARTSDKSQVPAVAININDAATPKLVYRQSLVTPTRCPEAGCKVDSSRRSSSLGSVFFDVTPKIFSDKPAKEVSKLHSLEMALAGSALAVGKGDNELVISYQLNAKDSSSYPIRQGTIRLVNVDSGQTNSSQLIFDPAVPVGNKAYQSIEFFIDPADTDFDIPVNRGIDKNSKSVELKFKKYRWSDGIIAPEDAASTLVLPPISFSVTVPQLVSYGQWYDTPAGRATYTEHKEYGIIGANVIAPAGAAEVEVYVRDHESAPWILAKSCYVGTVSNSTCEMQVPWQAGKKLYQYAQVYTKDYKKVIQTLPQLVTKGSANIKRPDISYYSPLSYSAATAARTNPPQNLVSDATTRPNPKAPRYQFTLSPATSSVGAPAKKTESVPAGVLTGFSTVPIKSTVTAPVSGSISVLSGWREAAPGAAKHTARIEVSTKAQAGVGSIAIYSGSSSENLSGPSWTQVRYCSFSSVPTTADCAVDISAEDKNRSYNVGVYGRGGSWLGASSQRSVATGELNSPLLIKSQTKSAPSSPVLLPGNAFKVSTSDQLITNEVGQRIWRFTAVVNGDSNFEEVNIYLSDNQKISPLPLVKTCTAGGKVQLSCSYDFLLVQPRAFISAYAEVVDVSGQKSQRYTW